MRGLWARLQKGRGAPRSEVGPTDPSGYALALIPLAVAVLLAALMLPRAVPPDEVPLPTIDQRALGQTSDADDARVRRVKATPLSAEVRSVGSAIRAFNLAEADGTDAVVIGHARDDVNAARRVAVAAGKLEDLLDLRALEMQQFLAEVRAYENGGAISHELTQLGGTFIQRITRAQWCVGRRLLMNDAVRRVAFKLTWNKVLYVDSDPHFAITLDETRLLYSFYFKHPHPLEAQRPMLAAIRAAVHDSASERHADDTLQMAMGGWLLPKIDELAKVDPTYPEPLGRAAALYMHHDYAAAATLYESWLEAHPNGPWALRVQNHLRAAVLGEEDRLR